jgi:hypothetical protein
MTDEIKNIKNNMRCTSIKANTYKAKLKAFGRYFRRRDLIKYLEKTTAKH